MNHIIFAGLPQHVQRHVYKSTSGLKSKDNAFKVLLDNACRLVGVESKDVLSGSRVADCVKARRLYCHYLRNNTNMSLTAIGKMLNLKHDTVHYYHRTCSEWLEFKDEEYIKLVTDYKLINKDMFVY